MTYDELVAALIKAREDKGLKQAELARRIEQRRAVLSNWEGLERRPRWEDLTGWMEGLGLRLVLQPGRATPQQRAAEAVARLDEGAAQLVARLVAVLEHMEPSDRRGLSAYLASLEVDLGKVAAPTPAPSLSRIHDGRAAPALPAIKSRSGER